jgi:demethylmenaquinone methyltransferase/2-methoxy-6-polyprenyl-1,4-benzoquinol methylase
MHPDQPSLGALMQAAGFGRVRWHNLTFGVVALHEGVRFS